MITPRRGIRTVAIFIVLSLTGVTLIGWGTSLPRSSTWCLLLASLGAALFGASVSNIFDNLKSQDCVHRTEDVLSRSLSAGFYSDHEKLRDFRGKLHHYHVTQIRGNFEWRYSLIDFTKSVTVGKLSTVTDYVDSAGKKLPYQVEAGVRDERFVLLMKACRSNEPTIVEVYPFMGMKFYSNHSGAVFVQSWDAAHLLSRAIISRNPVEGWTKPGSVDDEVACELDRIWEAGFISDYQDLLRGSKTEKES